ncbi:unnamed protein product, partial [Gulo gulo]
GSCTTSRSPGFANCVAQQALAFLRPGEGTVTANAIYGAVMIAGM